jgi:ABC-type glycerol-3-phosphate transport system substrate-binding protein
MRTLIVLVITFVILAVQFYLGLRKKKVLGAIMPFFMIALFIVMSFLEETTKYIFTGSMCIMAIIIVWFIGYFKSAKYEKSEIEKMKVKYL